MVFFKDLNVDAFTLLHDLDLTEDYHLTSELGNA
jgi:hypothetical protein